MRGQFWCKFQFGVGRNLWVMGGYGILGVWVKRGSTVFIVYPVQDHAELGTGKVQCSSSSRRIH